MIAMGWLAYLSVRSTAVQFVINFVLATSFSYLNSFMKSLQVIVYPCMILMIEFPERVQNTLKIMLTVCHLEAMPDKLVEWVYATVLRIEFKEDNTPPEKL